MHTTYNCISILQYSKTKTTVQTQQTKKNTGKNQYQKKGNHTEPQNGTRHQNSISQITFRALNVNRLGDPKKGRQP